MKPTIEDLFSYSNNMAEWVRQNPQGYEIYLKTAAKCQHYTVHNRMIIQGSMQGKIAGFVTDLNSWISAGFTIKEGAQPFYVMEKNNGEKTGYSVREVYEASAFNEAVQEPYYDKSILLDALFLNAPCPIEYEENLRHKAIYNPDKGIIQVSRGFKDVNEIFCTLSQEYAHAIMHQKFQEVNKDNPRLRYGRADNTFYAFSAAYILSERYGMLPENISIKQLPEKWVALNPKEFKSELQNVEQVLEGIQYNLQEKLDELYQGADVYAG